MVHADERIKAIPIAFGNTSMEQVARILAERGCRRAFGPQSPPRASIVDARLIVVAGANGAGKSTLAADLRDAGQALRKKLALLGVHLH
jgi:chloramphenicol 3-O-phosphotransferase